MRRILFVGLFLLVLPGAAFAAPAKLKSTLPPPFEISGWIPYWRAATGTADVLPHLANFTSIMPFGYIVQNDGSLSDAFGFSAASATSSARILTAVAKAQKVKIVPTVMWSNGAAIAATLRSGAKRRALEDAIATLAKANDFDGIDIDFENKPVETRSYFSLFLKGLYKRMGAKLLYCSIEPRTPPSAQYDVIPRNLKYANDYTAVNAYCDRVEIMAYDQGTIDLRLNAAASPAPYVPVADPQWVEKVVTLATKIISKKKLIIGVPTYGYEYDLIPIAQGYRYDLAWAFNPRYATGLASMLGITPSRNSAGELSFLYTPTTTPSNLVAAVGSASPLLATTTPQQRIVWWSDARAVGDKIALAKKLGVRGIALFKLDGGEDPNLWNVLPAK